MGGVLMIGAMAVSDSAEIVAVYLLAAVLHEMGHFLAAKVLNVGIKEINFGFSGVRIVTDERLTSYKNELLLALSGPLVNIAVFSGISLFFVAKYGQFNAVFLFAESFIVTGKGIESAIAFLAIASLIQAIINLMPVNTFDGGRILYCAMGQLVGERAAERTVEVSSAFSALLLWTVALYLMLRVGGGLGIYVFSACIFASMMKKGANET